MRNYLPSQFRGGLFLTSVNDKNVTNVAVKLQKNSKTTSKDLYFINKTLKTNVIKDGKIPIVAMEYVDVFMKQPNIKQTNFKAKPDAQKTHYSLIIQATETTSIKPEPFSLTFKKATWAEMGVILAHGSTNFWFIIVVVLLCLVISGGLIGMKW